MHVVFSVLYEIVFSFFLFRFLKAKSKRVLLDGIIFLTFECCTIVLYKRVLCVLYFLCYIFSKEKNNLITGERKLEEQWLGLGLGLGL